MIMQLKLLMLLCFFRIVSSLRLWRVNIFPIPGTCFALIYARVKKCQRIENRVEKNAWKLDSSYRFQWSNEWHINIILSRWWPTQHDKKDDTRQTTKDMLCFEFEFEFWLRWIVNEKSCIDSVKSNEKCYEIYAKIHSFSMHVTQSNAYSRCDVGSTHSFASPLRHFSLTPSMRNKQRIFSSQTGLVSSFCEAKTKANSALHEQTVVKWRKK